MGDWHAARATKQSHTSSIVGTCVSRNLLKLYLTMYCQGHMAKWITILVRHGSDTGSIFPADTGSAALPLTSTIQYARNLTVPAHRKITNATHLIAKWTSSRR